MTAGAAPEKIPSRYLRGICSVRPSPPGRFIRGTERTAVRDTFLPCGIYQNRLCTYLNAKTGKWLFTTWLLTTEAFIGKKSVQVNSA